MVWILQLSQGANFFKECIMNEDILKGKWNEIKGEIRSQWGNLTDDEVEGAKGNLSSIAGLIQQRYGSRKEEVMQRLEGILGRFNQKAQGIKDNLRDDSSAHP